MRIMFVGGGSGGHFYPLIAVAESLRDSYGDAVSLYYIGPDSYSDDSLKKNGITYVYCPSGKRRKYRSLLNFFDSFKIAFGILVAFFKLFIIYPDVVFSKGSYTSVPVVLAAKFLRIPILIHESDAVPGSANKLAAKFARYVAVSYDDAAEYFPAKKVALTGIPIRKSFFVPNSNPHELLGIPSDKPVVFITGGSLGAERINTLILDTLDELLPHYTVLHQAGALLKDSVIQTALARGISPALLERYFVLGHISAEEMSAAYDAASIVVSRAGSTSIAEISLKKLPSIIIPIPEEISHDQRTNAYAYAKGGAASVMEEKNLSDGLLSAEIRRILSDPSVQASMKEAAGRFTTPTAAGTLATTLTNIAAEH